VIVAAVFGKDNKPVIILSAASKPLPEAENVACSSINASPLFDLILSGLRGFDIFQLEKNSVI
jgi:hypothetical protein